MLPDILNHLWQSTLFTGGIAILVIVLRRCSAHVRFGLWLTASLKFLVPFAVLSALGAHLPRYSERLSGTGTSSHVVSTAFAKIAAPIPLRPEDPVVSAPRIPASRSVSIGLFALVWLGGSLTLTAFWFIGWWRIRRTVAASVAVAIEFPIPVRRSASTREPAVAGIVHPILLLPDGIERWLTVAQMRAVLDHERCHISRRDNLTAALHMTVEMLFWFHPLVWWLGRRLIAEREFACDEAVLAAGIRPKDYAEAIVRVCQNYLGSPLRCAAGVGGGALTKRIELILHPPRRVALSGIQALLLAGIASVVVAAPLVGGHSSASTSSSRDTGPVLVRNYEAVLPADTPSSDGKDLIIAASVGNLDQVRSLLRKGVPVDFQDSNGSGITPLTQAAQMGHAAVVRELLANKAQVEHRRNDGDTALILASGQGNIAVVESLLKAGAQVNDQWGTEQTALMAAAANGHQAVVASLLRNGADVGRETRFGRTALEFAAKAGHNEVVRLLLDNGADYRHRQFDGETALDLAVQSQQLAVVQTLVARGAGSRP